MSQPTRSQVHVERPLTNISVAYIQSATDFIASRVFPVVPVEKQADRYIVYNKGDWFRDEAQKRAPATESHGGGFNIDNTPTYFCDVYAYHKDVDEQIRANADAPINVDRDATMFVTQRLLLRREIEWATNYFKTGVWTTEVTGKNTSPGSNEFLQWDQASSTPIEDIEAKKWEIKRLTSYMPNKLIIGPAVFVALKNHPDILDRIKYTQRGIVTTDLLATLFGVDEVLVASAIENLAAEGADDSTVNSNMRFVYGKNALLCYAAPQPGILVPSAGYTFTWRGLLGAGAFGNRISRIPMPMLGQGTERIEGEMAFDVKVIGKDLGVFFADAVS